MSLFGVLGNGRGHRLLASRVVPRRRVKRLPAERLAAARLAGILNLLDDASPTDGRRQLNGADPQHESAARQPRHARALPTAPSVSDDPVNSANQVPVEEVPVREVPVPEVLASEVLASGVPGAGRHRRPGVQAAVDSAHLIPAPEVLPPEVPGMGRHRRPGVRAAVDWAHPNPAPAILTPAIPGAGHHRRSGIRAALALRAVRVGPPRVVLLGILVLLVAFAAVLGVRGSGPLESAQPHADAATSHSATVIVPGTR
jgi:hypothetical protein